MSSPDTLVNDAGHPNSFEGEGQKISTTIPKAHFLTVDHQFCRLCDSTYETWPKRCHVHVLPSLFERFAIASYLFRQHVDLCIGIPYNTYFYRCRKCMISLCELCHHYHNRSHHKDFVRCKGIQREPRMQEFELQRTCDELMSHDNRSRIECPSCQANLCLSCWGTDQIQAAWQMKHDEEHQDHKELIFVFPPHHFMLREYLGTCRCIDDVSVVHHCERCLKRKCVWIAHFSSSE